MPCECNAGEGCMCAYEVLPSVKLVNADDLLQALEDAYHPQNPVVMHPADFVTKFFELDGHEGLAYGRERPMGEEIVICCDCGKPANHSCGYFGHGLATLAELIDAFSNPVTPAMRQNEGSD